MPKRLSVVIPTYNRRDRLAMVLDALERQSASLDDFEVVVVDDGSTDGTAEWLERERRSFVLRPIRQANGGPARARNCGVQAAEGELILFIDDDLEPTPGLVAEHLRSHAAESNVVVMGPLASLPHYRQPWVRWEQEKVEAQYRAMSEGQWQPTFRQFWTGNASLARTHILAAGGFDVELLRAEDIDLGLRLHERGLQFRFNPEARGLHHAERSLDSWKNVHRSYGRIEVSILGRGGEDHLIHVLGENWCRMHPATSWLVRRTTENPRRLEGLARALETVIKAEESLQKPVGAAAACSLLANLLYWQASFEELGPERTARMLRHSELVAEQWGRRGFKRWLGRRGSKNRAA